MAGNGKYYLTATAGIWTATYMAGRFLEFNLAVVVIAGLASAVTGAQAVIEYSKDVYMQMRDEAVTENEKTEFREEMDKSWLTVIPAAVLVGFTSAVISYIIYFIGISHRYNPGSTMPAFLSNPEQLIDITDKFINPI